MALVLAAAGPLAAAPAEWKPAPGPLQTRWTKDVTPEKALPEYPRPQMVRKDWQNLNGLWQFDLGEKDQAAPLGKDLADQILVPFCVESQLSGVGKRTKYAWYRRTITVPQEWKGRHVMLHFGAVDWEAVVYLDGKKLGEHRGGYDGFSFDITDGAEPGKAAELVVGVFDPTSSGPQARGKQVDNPGGIMYTPTTGIWQTVWMEPVAEKGIAELILVPDVDGGCLKLTVVGRAGSDGAAVQAVATDGEKTVAAALGKVGEELKLPIAQAKLWSPDTPFLYGLKVTLKDGDKAADAVDSYFGMRKIAIATDDKGFRRMMLNGKFVFEIGFLDQGFWPDGIYTAPTDAALRYDIEFTKKLGMNLARKHVKVEPDRWYYWCDKLGLLVWQDMPSGDTTKDRKQFQAELTRLVEGRRNHPSIIVWVPFNEGWGQSKDPADTKLHVDLIHKLDPSRLVNEASGWTNHQSGDIADVHSYPGPGAPKPEKERASVLGEFGGLGLPIPGHLWNADPKKNWGYRGMADRADLTARYVALLRKTYELVEKQGLNAAVYTQTTDVETECNGLMTYDRDIIKPDPNDVAAANRGVFPPAPVVKHLVPTSEAEGIEWRYALDKPADNWTAADFDDSAWKAGPGGFGTAGTPGSFVRTKWDGKDIWLRRTFELKDEPPAKPQLVIHHDEDAEVYINGVKAASLEAFVSEYVTVPISPEAVKALKKGKNTFAVHCKQTQGGQYIDVGLVEILPPEKKK
jgi:hypothetical protein